MQTGSWLHSTSRYHLSLILHNHQPDWTSSQQFSGLGTLFVLSFKMTHMSVWSCIYLTPRLTFVSLILLQYIIQVTTHRLSFNNHAAASCDVLHDTSVCCGLLQLGGTIGDIEGMPFIEAFRQFQFRVERENFCCVLVSLILQVDIRMCRVLWVLEGNQKYFWFLRLEKSWS